MQRKTLLGAACITFVGMQVIHSVEGKLQKPFRRCRMFSVQLPPLIVFNIFKKKIEQARKNETLEQYQNRIVFENGLYHPVEVDKFWEIWNQGRSISECLRIVEDLQVSQK